MLRQYQSRTGKTGTCFRTCLACILNLRENQVPDFKRANDDPAVNRWLAQFGLQYKELTITDPAPLGYHFILGLSPRGGQHAVVGYDGKLVWDSHPMDHTGRGLVKPEEWGVLVPVNKAHDALLSGKRLNAAAEPLLTRHAAVKNGPARVGSSEAIYRSTNYEVAALLADAERLLECAKLDDDSGYWRAKLTAAHKYLDKAVNSARGGDYGHAVAYQEAAFSATHAVLSKLRHSGARDETAPYKPGDKIRLKGNGGLTTTVDKAMKGADLFGRPCWYVWTTTGECVVIHEKEKS